MKPPAALKIDKSFIDPIPRDGKAGTITQAIIELAHNLDFGVVAEGVETLDQVAFLEERNCDNYQGYYFAYPLHPDEFGKLLSKGKVKRGV